jgi:predicted dehydrogenase
MRALRLGIVGCGAMADYHAQRFAKLPGVEVAACCDHLAERAAAFAAGRGIPHVFPDAGAMVGSGTVDAVTVASIDKAHATPVLAALGAGLPVLCEKPMARTLAEARSMAEAEGRAGVPALVNFSKRNGGLLALAGRLVAGGELGRVKAADFSYLQSWLLQPAWGDWRESPRWRWRLEEGSSTFGAMGDLGSHLFDAAILILGTQVPTGCQAWRLGGPRVIPGAEALVLSSGDLDLIRGQPAWMAFEANAEAFPGIKVKFRASFCQPGSMDAFQIRITGDRAGLALDLERSRSRLELISGGVAREIEAEACPSTYERFAALASGRPDPLPGADSGFAQGLAVQGLIDSFAAMALARETP